MTTHRTATTVLRAARRTALAVAVAVGVAAASAADARPRSTWLTVLQEADGAPQLVPAQRGGGVSLAQATAMAQGRFSGRVVRAETVQVGDRVVHEVRILGDDGRVRTVRIDAQTGAFL